MAIPAAIVILPLGVLLYFSGLVINVVQNSYRRINREVAELLWLELVWLIDWWAGVKIKVYADSETYKLMAFRFLGSTVAVMKKSSKLLPVTGWSIGFSEYLFLDRNWAKDESALKSGFQRLRDFPRPFLLALFVEGTHFTQAKLLAAHEYASSAGLPVPRNVLIPRTKGFVTAVSQMRSYVPAIYDVTVTIPKTSPPPAMLRLFKGQSSVVHVHLKRHLMKDLPETDDAVAQWCRDVFMAKDKLLDKHIAEGSFGEKPQH